jgi:hypothetical protein
MSSDDKANKLMVEAGETADKFSFFTSKDEKRANARQLYIQAAGIYKANQNFVNAATAFQRAADMAAANKSDIDVADDLGNVLLMHLKCDNFDAAKSAANKVIDFFMRSNKSSQAAKVCQTIGEWKPTNGSKLNDEQRREQETYLEKAMTFYRQEGSRSTANEMRLKVIERKVANGELEAASKEYEQVGKEVLDDQLLRSTAQKHFFMSLLCLVGNLQAGKLTDQTDQLRRKFESIQDLDTQFNQYTQEYILINGLIEALENEDIEKYEDAQDNFAEICAVDTLKARLLLQGKQALRASCEGNAR